MRVRPVLLACSLALGALPATAQTTTSPPAMQMPAAPSPGSKALADAMARMSAAMNVPATGNVDRDFVAQMIPHHQGAIDMAEAELRYGDDPTMRALARRIVAAQTREIAEMKRWQVKHGEKHAQ